METEIAVALIGGFFSLLAALIGGGALGRSEWFQRTIARNPFPKLEGARLESKWKNEIPDNPGQHKEYREIIEIKKQKHGRVYGHVTMDDDPTKKWDVEGDYDGRFLRLFWHATHDKFYLDHGCYFFERQGDGTFKGYSVGFDARLNKVHVDEHTVRPVAPPT